MLKVTDIIPDVTKSIGTQLWLLDVRPYDKYDNGIRSTAVEGYKYTIAAIDKGLAKLDVKIPGVQLMDAPEKYLPVRITGLEMRIYRRDGDYGITAVATGIAPVQPTQPQQHQQANK